MPLTCARARAARAALAFLFPVLVAALALLAPGCRPGERPLLPRSQTWAELRTVRREVTVKAPGEEKRAPYPRERLVDGEEVEVSEGGLAWLRRDGGATLLVRGPARLSMRADAVELAAGRVMVDTPTGVVEQLATPSGPLHLADVRASLDVGADGASTEVYVLAGEVRAPGAADAAGAADKQAAASSAAGRAGAGQRLLLRGKGAEARAETSPALIWEDWTGGLLTTDRAAEPAPYGVGTVGARRPGEQGAPRFPLAIQRLDVNVTIDGDFAVTEVDEVFFNPSGQTVEGVYRFRTPEGAILHRFGVDRDGVVVWGRVKEKQAAAAQYQANVYAGSTEDPALLEWDAPGVYRARLYPIGPGESRRVVVRYAEWLGRTGAKGERRHYVYPMAAEGADSSLPVIEELSARVNLSRAGAKEVRVGMQGAREGDTLIVRAHDLTPRADLSVELFDEGVTTLRGVSAKHVVDLEALPPEERGEAQRRAQGEADYVLVPLRAGDVRAPEGGLDLVIVMDTSAATDPASLAIGRAATAALLAHLGPGDRAGVWAGDSTLRPITGAAAGAADDALAAVDEARRRRVLAALSAVDRGGATDLGAMLAEAAGKLDPARRGAVVYIGDGAPTVGERSLADLRDRLAKLPRPVRIFGLGVGDTADLGILKGLARGALAERVSDANGAARAALRVLEQAERPAWLGVRVDLGPEVERIFPRDLGALVADEGAFVVGRLTGRKAPTRATLSAPGGGEPRTMPLQITAMDDQGDLRRRWAEGRLAQMLDEGVGRAAMVDLGSRYGIITPVTSLYVPTRKEMTGSERAELERRREQAALRLEKQKQNLASRPARGPGSSPGWFAREKAQADQDRDGVADEEDAAPAEQVADNKEGGTGTRAKGEEGSMGRPTTATAAAAPPAATATAPAGGAAASAVPASPPPPPADVPVAKAAETKPDANAEPAPPAEPSPARAARQDALKDAQEFGMIGLSPSGGKAAFGGEVEPIDETTRNADSAFRGNMWGDSIGDSVGAGGLGLSGAGEGGGGIAEGEVGANGLGQGFGSGHGRLGGAHRTQPPKITAGPMTLYDGDDKTGVRYGEGEKDRSANAKANAQTDTGGAAGARVTVQLGDLPHLVIRCSAAAGAPLEERAGLWRERLARVAGNAQAVAQVYRRALADCEAPSFRERARLLALMLDAMPTTSARVSLWRVMFRDLGAADVLYRGILARVRTPAELRELHQALGLKTIDPGILEKTLAEAKTPAARAAKLRELARVWPDDRALALKLLDALEDAGDDAGARELARALRARPDADAAVRTAVGELHLRLSARAQDPAQKASDEAEARRTFGEIVEFAPEDPAARRRLGDLLRAHGWYDEAARQYETLARLAPDDASVALLLAAAAQGTGKLEEAVRWTEKGGAAGAPDLAQSPAQTARALAATYLAWGRIAAREAGRKDEVEALAARLRRVRSGEGVDPGVEPAVQRAPGDASRRARVTLTWAHPELHPTLWSNALGAPMPAPEGDVTLGVAQVMLPEREGLEVQVRLEPDAVEQAARLGAEAILTVVFDEAGPDEVIARVPVRFARGGAATKRFSVAGRAVQEVSP